VTARARSTGGVHGTYGHAAPQTQDLRFDLLTVAASWGGLFAAGSPSTLYLRSASQQQVVVRGQGAHAARDHRSTGMDPQHQTGARGDRTQQMDVEPLRAWGVGRGCWSLARHVRPSPRARQPADTRHGDDPATHMQILGVSSGHVQYAGHHVFQMHHPQMHIPCSPGLPLVCCPPGA
jgi:hypothetical protein